MKSFVLLLIAILALWSNGANAVQWYVSTAGTASNTCTSLADACDLATAIPKVSPGDEIEVMGGLYKPSAGHACGLTLPLTFSRATIAGKYNPTLGMFPVFDCEETNRFMTIDGGAYNTIGGVSIKDINIKNTKTAAPISPLRGAAIGYNMAGQQAFPNTLENVNIEDSTLVGSGWGDTGGCVDFRSSFVEVKNSTFVNCYNNGGKLSGALYVFGNTANPGYVYIVDSLIDRAVGSVGGGVLTEGNQNAMFERTTFSNNFASCCGGAVDDGGFANTTFKDCIFDYNYSNKGGIYYGFSGGGTKFINCRGTGNYATESGGIAFIGQSKVAFPSFDGCHFTNTSATADAGAIRIGSLSAQTVIKNSIFDGVSAQRSAMMIEKLDKLPGGHTIQNVTLKNIQHTLGAAINTETAARFECSCAQFWREGISRESGKFKFCITYRIAGEKLKGEQQNSLNMWSPAIDNCI